MNKRKLSILLAAIMCINMVLGMAIPVYADVDERIAMMEEREAAAMEIVGGEVSEDEDSETEIPEAIQAVLDEMNGETTTPSDADEPTDEEDMQNESVTDATSSDADAYLTLTAEADDGVIVMLEADEGVFPEGVTLEASVATPGDAKKALEEVSKIDDSDDLVQSTTYDIKVMLGEEEVQPDNDKGNVRISFVMDNLSSDLETAGIYHHTEDGVETVLEDACIFQTEDAAEEVQKKIEEIKDIAGNINNVSDSYYASLDGAIENDVNDCDADELSYDDFDLMQEMLFDCDDCSDCKDCNDCNNEKNLVYENENFVHSAATENTGVAVLTAEVASFSMYTVNLYGNSKNISLRANTEATISDLLNPIGLVGEVTDVKWSSSKSTTDKIQFYLNAYNEWVIKVTGELSSEYSIQVQVNSSYQTIKISTFTFATTSGDNGKQKVYLRGFANKETDQLRASELLEVCTEGFSNNAVFEYDYTIVGKSGQSQIELYPNADQNLAPDPAVRVTGSKAGSSASLKNTPYKYFAAPSAYTTKDITVTVTVRDVGADSSTKGVELTCSYSNFGAANLMADIRAANFILYEDDETIPDIRKMYALSGVTHILCNNAKTTDLGLEGVTTPEYTGGLYVLDNGIVKITYTGTLDSHNHMAYALTPLKRGRTSYSVNLDKSGCRQHYGQKLTESTTLVWVIYRPTFIKGEGDNVIVENVEPGVSYTINGVTQRADSFEPLTFVKGNDDTCIVSASEGECLFIRPEPIVFHEHDWVYSTDGTKIVAQCKATDSCSYKKTPQELTLEATDAVYDGNQHGATAHNTSGNNTILGDQPVVIKYRKFGESIDLPSVPTEPSKYVAYVTITGPDSTGTIKNNTIQKVYSITRKENEIKNLDIENWTYGSPSSTPSCEPKYGTPTYKFYKKGPGPDEWTGPLPGTPSDAGDYKIVAEIATTSDYNGCYAEKPFTIYPQPIPVPATQSAVYDGKFHSSHFEEISGLYTAADVTKRETGVYDVLLTIDVSTPSNYKWADDTPGVNNTAYFEITKALDNEIPEIFFPDEFPYGTPSSTPSCQPKYGSPSDVKYWYDGFLRDGTKYGPTDKQPTEAGNYTIHASLSETPEYPAAYQKKDFIIHALEVKEPEIASKSYTGKKQIADVPSSDKYNTKKNDGGIDAKPDYPVELRLATPNNYYWSKLGEYPYAPETTVPFEITKASDNEIPEIFFPDEFPYGTPSSTPSSQPKYGSPSDVKYWYDGFLRDGTKYGPTDKQPTEAGHYTVHASLSETPEYPAAYQKKDFIIHALEVKEPEIASKSYTGKKQIADVPSSDKYNTKKNDGGIVAKPDYPVELRLATPNNYYWSKLGEYPYAPETTVPFEITKANNNEIKNLNIENWTYGSPSSTPSCEPKYGTPTYKFYKKGPGPDEWTGPLPGTPSDAGDYKIVAEIATTSDYNGCYAEMPFTIYPQPIPVPATQSAVYDGKFHSSHFEEISGLYTAADVTKRETGVYDVLLTIDVSTPSNYKWADDTPGVNNTAYFEITKALDNEIPEIFFPDEFPYGTPSSTPSCQPKYGSPSDVKYWYEGTLRDGTKYGPTDKQPTEAGHYTIHASLSETPEYPAAYQKKDFIIHALEVKEPEIASKSYTGKKQIADVPSSDKYNTKKNDGGIDAKPDYPVELRLATPNNYYWSKLGEYPYAPETTVPFEITKASDNEIPEIFFPDEFPYGTPSSTPSSQPKYGSPSEVKYWYEGTLRDGTKYGPTDKQPTEAGKYTIHASLSETPNYPAAHQQKNFIIHALEVKEPEIASKSYTGMKQIADVPSSDKYNTKKNDGGIVAKPDYPVELRLATPNNYYWSKLGEYPYAPETTVPFEIMPAQDNTIEELEMEDYIYSSPSSIPTCKPKFGTPSYTFYEKGPGPDEWTGPLPGTPSQVGEYKIVAEIATTSDYNGCSAEDEFSILPAEVEVPVIKDKVYSGMKQKAYIDQSKYMEGDKSIIVASSNEGWYGEKTATCSYGFYLELDDNHVWNTTKEKRVDLIFRIIPDPMDDKKKTPEEKAKGETYESGKANIKVWTYKEEGAPTTYIENLNLALAYGLLTSEEQEKYDNGEDMAAEIRLEVRPKDEASLSQTEKDEIQKQISSITNGQLGVYLDLTLWKDVTIGTSPMYTTALHDTAPNTIRIRVSVPEPLRKQNRTYYVARVHEDIGSILPTAQVADTWIDLDFETTKFSTYAILYSDPSAPSPIGGGSKIEYKWWKPTDSGWVKRPGTEDWYVIRDDSLVKGWFHDNEDSYWYYLDPTSGIMREGWQQIGSKWYYFTPIDQVPQGTWFFNQNGDGKWHYYGDKSFHTHGSMYCNEMTPDGYWVDETGALVDENAPWWSAEEADAGWVKKTGTTDWYYIKNNTLKKGWHDDPEDGHRYYLDPVTGIMFKNWNRIGNYMYYFTTDSDVPEQTWFNDRTTDGKWHYYGDANVLHPLGSMYRNETTPDGRTVDANGHKIN